MSIVLFLATLISIMALTATVGFCLNKHPQLAGRIFRGWSVGAAVYVTVLGLVAMWPTKAAALKPGTPYCGDDWCMSIDGVSKTRAETGFTYQVALRVFSRANKGTRSAQGAWMDLIDDRNRRFSPVSDSSLPPFEVELNPGQSVDTVLTFNVPADANNLVLAVGLEGVHYSSFVIGNGDLLGKPRLELKIG
jgi:hypothetical protein